MSAGQENPGDCGREKTDFDKSSWMISVGLAVFAAVINNVGVNLQKLAWTKKQSESSSTTVYRTYWLLGMVGIVGASLFDFAALAFGPQSVIAPLGSLTMVANGCVAPWMHGEKLHENVVKSTVIIIIGCIVSVATASHSNEICGIDAIFALYRTSRFVIYAFVIIILLGAGTMAIKSFEETLARHGENSEQYQSIFKFHRFSYAALSGVFGAQSVLFAKSVDELLVSSIRGDSLFLGYPGTYVVIACMAGSIVMQLYWLNQGLARFESLYNVPVFTSTWIVFTIIAGGVMYNEFAKFTFVQAMAFPTGVGLCCLGVFHLSKSAKISESVMGDDSERQAMTELGQTDDSTEIR